MFFTVLRRKNMTFIFSKNLLLRLKSWLDEIYTKVLRLSTGWTLGIIFVHIFVLAFSAIFSVTLTGLTLLLYTFLIPIELILLTFGIIPPFVGFDVFISQYSILTFGIFWTLFYFPIFYMLSKASKKENLSD